MSRLLTYGAQAGSAVATGYAINWGVRFIHELLTAGYIRAHIVIGTSLTLVLGGIILVLWLNYYGVV